MPEAKRRRFSKRTYATPFGRFQATGSTEAPANEVLIGREGQRAYFIDLLLRLQRRGAILVTGRRGAGKTSFVRYGLKEYKEEVFERFLASNVGRATFWDRLGVMLIGLLALAVFLMLSDLMEVLLVSVGVGGDGVNGQAVLAWLLIIPLALLCVYPVLFAAEVVRECLLVGLSLLPFRTLREILSSKDTATGDAVGRSREQAISPAIAWAITLLLGLGLWFLGVQGAPAISASRLFYVLSLMYLLTESLPSSPKHKEDSQKIDWKRLGFQFLHILPLILLLKYWRVPEPFPDTCPTFQAVTLHVLEVFLFGFLFLGTGLFFRHLWRVSQPSRPITRTDLFSNSGYLIVSIFSTGIAACCLLYLWWHNPWAPWSIWSILGWCLPVVLSMWTLWRNRCKERPVRDVELRPLLGVMMAAFLALVVALQLLHPLLANWSWPSHLEAVISTGNPNSEPEQRIFVEALRQPTSLSSITGLQRNVSPSPQFSSDLFHGVREELYWLFGMFTCFLLLYFMQYEWILRPLLRHRQDSALYSKTNPESRDPHAPPTSIKKIPRQELRNIASLTLPWGLYKTWLPVTVISVNLGFEKLDHRRVIHAMLAGLRSSYHRRFLAWNSSLANLGRSLGLLLFIALTTLVTSHWFQIPLLIQAGRTHTDTLEGELNPALKRIQRVASNDYQDVCKLFQGKQKGPSLTNLVCLLPWGDSLIHGLYFNLLPDKIGSIYTNRKHHMLFYFLPYREDQWPSADTLDGTANPEIGHRLLPMLQPGFEYRIYHVAILLFFFVVGRWLLLRFQVFPYQHNLRRIDHVMEHLSSRVTSRKGRWKPAEWIQNLIVKEEIHQSEQDPLDPRIIEFAFLEVIEEIQDASLRLPAGQFHLFSLPAPELTFVFDELDKLGTRISPHEADSSGRAQQVEIVHAERRRSRELHKLLADMKNLLSSAPARFIFVGGRNLHDEWLADQTARQPLLTNIFQAEIYLPSLLVDHRWDQKPSLSHNIEVYLLKQKQRAERLHARYELNRALPSFSLVVERQDEESFVEVQNEVKRLELEFFECDPSNGKVSHFDGQEDLRRDFIQFLTYRSMGNPKKLKEMVMDYCRPVGRFVSTIGTEPFDNCHHVLVFADPGRFRIQFLSDVYRHIVLRMERRLLERDDKLVISIFYLADFLFKFHKRAFSWANMERVDELVHIHRAPDLRDILGVLVSQWSERFLHPIRNGMYDFRFRSEVAQEIEFISRQSDDEMAAFNFTLDESLTLKSLYESNIARLSETQEPSQELVDQIAGLGELHEFDQEYETARYHYRRAIALLDRELVGITGKGAWLDDRTPTMEILGLEGRGPDHVRRYMTWGIARLRLMLQVGMSYELARDLERALVEYRNARTLASSLILSMLGKGAQKSQHLVEQLDALKHLNIVFQPAFAESWVTEKLAGGVDTSITLAEKSVWDLRLSMPFVMDAKFETSNNTVRVQNSNFSLIIAELHNKVGDLYFFKGRQTVSQEDVKKWQQATDRRRPRKGLEGYLLKAHYHYAVSLHDLRRYISHRIESSGNKLNIWHRETFGEDEGEPGNFRERRTIASGAWPDFVFRSAGGSLLDFAETMLGRVSLFALFKFAQLKPGLPEEGNRTLHGDWPSVLRNKLVSAMTSWFEEGLAGQDGDASTLKTPLTFPLGKSWLQAGELRDWLGHWRSERDFFDLQLIEFKTDAFHDDPARLLTSLQLTLVGAKYLEKAGYLEDSARELLGVCQTATNYLWWCLTTCRVVSWIKNEGEGLDLADERLTRELSQAIQDDLLQHPLWSHLVAVALYALEKADLLFSINRHAEEADAEYLVGDKIPTSCLTLACSLGLAADCMDPSKEWGIENEFTLKTRLCSLISSWTGEPVREDEFCRQHLQELLETVLVRHSYPLMNRLHALKVLIDSRVLQSCAEPEPEVGEQRKSENWTLSQMEEVLDWTDELLDLRSQLAAPMHFTPLHSGITSALVYLRCRHDLSMHALPLLDSVQMTRIRRAAGRELRRSEEMCTMRRSYYEAISDLYYLYDDFNERQLHFNHALQMAGSELVSLLSWLVTRPDVRKEKYRYVPDLRGKIADRESTTR